MTPELDPRFDWVEVTHWGDLQPLYIKGNCRHLDVVPVESDGKTVAWLCRTCDQQLAIA